MDAKRLLERLPDNTPRVPKYTDIQLAKVNWELEEAILSNEPIVLVVIPPGVAINFTNLKEFIKEHGGSGD